MSGMWKQRFPVLRGLRCHYNTALEVTLATAVLHNLSVLWREPLPDGHNVDIPPEIMNDQQGQVVVVDMDLDRAAIRAEGDLVRDRLRQNMPPPTQRERRIMNRFRN